MTPPRRPRARARAATTSCSLLLAAAVVAGCAPTGPPTPPSGVHGTVTGRDHITRYRTEKVPDTTHACSTRRDGRRTCREITTGSRRVRRLAYECWQIRLDTGTTRCVSRALYAATEKGDRW